MVAIINYAIFTNACFTSGYFLPDNLPIYYLPKQFMVNYLIAHGDSTQRERPRFPRDFKDNFPSTLTLPLQSDIEILSRIPSECSRVDESV